MKHIVGFSGGVDSQACALWVREHFPAEDIILLNSDAGGHEHPLTMQFVREYSEKIFPVTTVNALVSDMWKTPGFAETRGMNGSDVLTFQRMIEIKGRPPSRKAQFCTEMLKLRPQRRWVQANVEDDYERYTGVRREEGQERANTKDRDWDAYFDCYVNHPIAAWKKEECFRYVMAAGEFINPLYKLGFDRVGCAPCINAKKGDIALWIQRFPEVIERVRKMEQETKRTFFAPCVPGMYTNNIDDVVIWSQTSHGGKQFNILNSIERPACESKYGLCE